MTYFEDTLTFSEITKKNLVGSVYFIIAILGVCLNLATLTVLPDCEKTLTKPLFVLFCTQLFTNIGALIFVGVPVPYMIAGNKPFFLNPILLRAPGTLMTAALILSFSVQFWICINRNSSIVFPKLTQLLFSDAFLYIIHFVSLIFTVNRVVNLSDNTEIRTFNIASLSWIQTDSEYLEFLSILAYAGMVCLMFYALSFFDLLYKHIYAEYDAQDVPANRPIRRLLNQLIHLICDIIFGLLLVLPRVKSSSNFSITHSIITIYGTILWPTISLVVYSEHVRRELCFRVLMMAKGSQMTGPDICPTRRANDNRLRFI